MGRPLLVADVAGETAAEPGPHRCQGATTARAPRSAWEPTLSAFRRSRGTMLEPVRSHAVADPLVALAGEHLTPAVSALEQAARDGDRDAVRALAYEAIVVAGLILGECRGVRGVHVR